MSHVPDSRPTLWRYTLAALPIGFAIVLFGWGMSAIPFFTKGEPREGVVVWDMVHTGNWILPLRNGVEIPSKPPLFHWLGALTSLAIGSVTEFAIRAPSVGLGILALALTYLAAARAWGQRAALLASVALVTSFEWVRAATTARVDMTLTFFMLAALILIWEIDRAPPDDRSRLRAIGVGLLLALATLAKGPVGALLPAAIVGAYALARRDLDLVRKLRPFTMFAVIAVLAGSWYALAIWMGGERFVTKQLLNENLLRFFATDRGTRGHAHSPLYLLPAFLGGMAPWTLFAPAVGVFLAHHRRRLRDQHLLFPLVWFVGVLLFYSLSSGKRGVYILPAYPAAALLLGAWWSGATDRDPPSRGELALGRWASYATATLLGVVGVALIAIALGSNVFTFLRSVLDARDAANLDLVEAIATSQRPILALGGAAIVAIVALLPRSLRHRPQDGAFAPLAVSLAIGMLLVRTLYFPVLAEAHSIKPFMARVRATVGQHHPLHFFKVHDYAAIYYAHQHIQTLEHLPPASAPPIFVLMRRIIWKALPPTTRAQLYVVDRSQGTGPKGNRRLVLLRTGGNGGRAPRGRAPN